jgi:uncharacterized membrane protein
VISMTTKPMMNLEFLMLTIRPEMVTAIIFLVLVTILVVLIVRDRNRYHSDESDTQEADRIRKTFIEHAKKSFKGR